MVRRDHIFCLGFDDMVKPHAAVLEYRLERYIVVVFCAPKCRPGLEKGDVHRRWTQGPMKLTTDTYLLPLTIRAASYACTIKHTTWYR